MKTTKNQADAVRSYLSGLGFVISHVQALEVIARGQGLRSRHVKPSGPSLAGQPVHQGCARCDAEKALRDCSCSKCGSALENGYCPDSTCIYYDWPQEVLQYDVYEFPTAGIEKKYGLKKRVHAEPELTNGEKLRLKYGEDEEHPDYPRGDWLFVASKGDTQQTYWDWVATRLDSIDSDELLSDEERSERIKAEYLASRCHADDVDYAVNRLMSECGAVFADARKAWQFVMEESHEDVGDEVFVVQCDSAGKGTEVLEYFTEEERRAGVIRLMAEAVDANDSVARSYFFSEVSSDLDKKSPAYITALTERRLEGEINEATEVFYQGTRIGTIAEITEDDLTLYSCIDDNP